jgi:DNA processing protein
LYQKKNAFQSKMEKRGLLKLLALKGVKGYGNKKILDLINSFGTIDKVYEKSPINKNGAGKYEKILDFCENNGISILTFFDMDYPNNLKKISSPPLVLFTKGNLELLKKPSLSIVGTRAASDNTIKWAHKISRELSNSGYVIVSGGAIGIDAAAHQGALDGTGNTICVLGSGLNKIYPKENLRLIESISKKGLVISEFYPDHNVDRISLLSRNRITSGLADGLLLAATKTSGGAMSQYKIAASQKKQIFCPHPDLGLEPTEGIKQIIKTDKKIKLIKTAQDILECSGNPEAQIVLNSFV